MIAKYKYHDYLDLKNIIIRDVKSYTVFFLYFLALTALKKKEKEKQSENLDGDPKTFHNCEIDTWVRFFMLWLAVLIPTFLMIFFGAFLSIRKYEKRIKKPLVPESNYNKNSLMILHRAENFMLFKTFWTMTGMTIWSLRNIFTLFKISHFDCFK